MDISNEKIQQSQLHAQFANIGLINDQLNYLITKVEEIDNKIKHQQEPIADEKEDIIQVKEAAKVIGRSVSTVYIKASKGHIPCWNDSGRLLFSRKDLNDWILANKPKQNDQKNEEESVKEKMKRIRNRHAKKK